MKKFWYKALEFFFWFLRFFCLFLVVGFSYDIAKSIYLEDVSDVLASVSFVSLGSFGLGVSFFSKILRNDG